MLSNEDNELLTRVGPGTPMGDVLRQYWLPLLLSFELPEQDGPPLRVRLLGENLIAFRDTDNRVGLLADNCSHRGASLFYGRNEESGLRCVYHGWKYDVAGDCVDMPNEPPESNFKDKIHHQAYPCRELNGIIWTYMGPRDVPPGLPEFEWAMVPEEQRSIRVAVRGCNWVQAMEGGLDLSHGSYLHSILPREHLGVNHTDRFTGDIPRFEALDTEYGVKFGVRRIHDGEHYHWGIGHFVMPFTSLFPPVGDTLEASPGQIWIPMDDETTLVWSFVCHPTRSIADGARFGRRQPQAGAGPVDERPDRFLFAPSQEFLPPTTEPAGRWRLKGSRDNDFLFSEEDQRTKRYSGVPTVELQDAAMTVSMGGIIDRTIEHLGSTDVAQIRARHCLINAARALREKGIAPPGVDRPSVFRLRSASGVLPKDTPWFEATQAWVEARPDNPVRSRAHRR